MKVELTEPERVRPGSVLRITGELLTVEGITPLTVPEVQPGRGESYMQPALRISERGLASTALPHYAGESIVFMPDRPVVVPGAGVEHVDLYAENSSRGRLMITTASEPQPGQLVRLRFGDGIQGDDQIILSPEAAENGDSLAAYGLAAGALESTGFAIYVATAPRPSSRYAVRFAVTKM